MRHLRHCLSIGSVALLAAASQSLGLPQQAAVRPASPAEPSQEADPVASGPDAPWLRIELGPKAASHPLLGSFELQAQETWKPVCSSDTSSIDQREFEAYVQRHRLLASGLTPSVVVSSGPGSLAPGGLDLVFVVSGSIPAGALPAIAAAEAYLEGVFTADPMTVTIPLTFQVMASNVLGGTSSASGYLTYADMRSVLVGGMDAGDSIQAWLPTGTTCPVRYGSSTKATNEDRVFTNFATFKANGGSVAGNDASMTFNSVFTWDFDPANGVSTGTYSFQDVLVHETGHALGFTSGGDFRSRDIDVLDLFRFQRTDGTKDLNPDTLAEFQTKARLVAYNIPNDDHNSDLISVEYRMSDGSPYQMSHFREQTANIGLMDPAFAAGESYYPAFLSSADAAMFDAIGYDL